MVPAGRAPPGDAAPGEVPVQMVTAVQPRFTPIEVLDDLWWIGLVALGVSLVLTPVVRLIAYRTKIVDRPDDLLKPHGRPIAYLGGLAMCVGLLAGLAAYLAVLPDAGAEWSALAGSLSRGDLRALQDHVIWKTLAFAVASVLITLVGLADDLCDIRPRMKVYGQVGAAVVLLFGGIGHTLVTVFASSLRLPNPPMWIGFPVSCAVCVMMVVATCNATNLLDGLDGLCGGVTGIVALGFLALAVSLAQWGRLGYTDHLRVAICLAMAGGVLGFLPYNIPPASIFMGDAGSMLLGFFVATMMVLFCAEGTGRWLVASVAVFALPILDTALAVVRRLLAGRSIFAGDRSHLYDQLVDRGMSVKQVVVLFYILSVLAAVIGVSAAVWLRARYAVALYAVSLVVIWIVFHKKGMIRPDKAPPDPGIDATS